MDAHHLVEPADLEGATEARRRTGDPEVRVAAPGAGQAVDQDTQSGRVDEPHGGEVDDDGRRAVLDQAPELIPERRNGGDVDLATRGEDGVAAEILNGE